jgi:acyl-CoA synthetase (AMP-forming)/AMP-acid ligase II/ankyrin repeat protein
MQCEQTMSTCLDEFTSFAATHPLALALVHHDGSTLHFTYQELSKASMAAALGLREAGLQHGQRILSFCDESPSLVIAFLGIAAAGGVVVPVDPATPHARLQVVLADCGAYFALCGCEWEEALSAKLLHNGPDLGLSTTRLKLVTLEAATRVGSKCMRESQQQPQPGGRPSQPVPTDHLHLIYTSGSTGRPKAVVVTHAAMHAYSRAKRKAHRLEAAAATPNAAADAASDAASDATPDAASSAVGSAASSQVSRVLIASAHTWDPCIGDVLSTLAAGATLCTAPRAQLLQSLGATIRALGVTHVCATPSLWSLLSCWQGGDAQPGSRNALMLPSLRFIALGGEPLPFALVSRWLTASGELAVANTYGVTEATVYQTLGVISRSCACARSGGTLGGGTLGGGTLGGGTLGGGALGGGTSDSEVGVCGGAQQQQEQRQQQQQQQQEEEEAQQQQRGARSRLTASAGWGLDGVDIALDMTNGGEILLGGEQVAVGYHGRPELTAERFVWIHVAEETEVAEDEDEEGCGGARRPRLRLIPRNGSPTPTYPSRQQRWFRTGDLGAWDEDDKEEEEEDGGGGGGGGQSKSESEPPKIARQRQLGLCGLRVLGRLDGQIKLRGIRVELGEIEAVARRSGVISAAAATVFDGQQLVLFIVPAEGEGLSGAAFVEAGGDVAVRLQLMRWLPPPLQPSRVIPLASLPLTPGGKLMRGKLPPPPPPPPPPHCSLDGAHHGETAASGYGNDSSLHAQPDSLRGATEVAVAKAWRETLPPTAAGHNTIHPHSNFWELGGTSLIAVQMLERLRGVLTPSVAGGSDAFRRGNQRFATRLCGLYRKPRLRDFCVWLEWAAMPPPPAPSLPLPSEEPSEDSAPHTNADGALLAASDLALPESSDIAQLATAALPSAALLGHRGLVSELLAARADPEAGASRAERCTTPLMHAAGRHDGRGSEVVATLLAAGARVNAATRTQATAAHRAAAGGCAASLALLLRADKCAVRARDLNKWSVLFHAAWAGSAPCVSLLLASPDPPPVNATDRWGRSPLCWACAAGHFEVARCLLGAGADARGAKRPQAAHLQRFAQVDWSTPLHLALHHYRRQRQRRGHTGGGGVTAVMPCATTEPQTAATAHICGGSHESAEENASDAQGLALIRMLLASGADPNGLDQNGWTAVETAAWLVCEKDAEEQTGSGGEVIGRGMHDEDATARAVVALLEAHGGRPPRRSDLSPGKPTPRSSVSPPQEHAAEGHALTPPRRVCVQSSLLSCIPLPASRAAHAMPATRLWQWPPGTPTSLDGTAQGPARSRWAWPPCPSMASHPVP